MKNRLAKINIIIATKNSGKTLRKTLQSIKKQNYPQNRIEVLIIDGGSTDKTRTIAKEFGYRVLDNPAGGFIPAKNLGFLQAGGDYAIYLDSDEELNNPNSIKLKVNAFASNTKIKAITTSGYSNPKNFPFINRYINEFGDPFSFFIYRSTKNYQYFLKELSGKYTIISDNNGFTVFDFSKVNPLPIIELVAFGCMVDIKYLKRVFPQIGKVPDLIPHLFYLLAKKGALIAIAKDDPVIHYSADTFSKYLKKIAWRIRNNIFNKETFGEAGFEGRDKFQSPIFRLKRFLFIPYSLSLIFPIIDSLYLILSRKDFVFLVHPFLCIYTSSLILYYYSLNIFNIRPELKTYGT